MPIDHRPAFLTPGVPHKRPDPSSKDTTAPTRLDPAETAITILMDRAIRASGIPRSKLGTNGTVCILVLPSPDWDGDVLRAWRHQFRSGTNPHHFDSYLIDRSGWTIIHRTDREEFRSRHGDLFARAISMGMHVLLVTTDETMLAPELIATADHRLVMPAPTADDVAAIARILTRGVPRTEFPPSLAGWITPRTLRLSRRPRQSATRYVEKLIAYAQRYADAVSDDQAADVAASPANVPTDHSPRAAPTLDRLHGMDAAVAWGRQLALDVADYKAGRIAWSDVDRGALLSGPPGCGKTLFAQAIAASTGMALVTGSYGQWLANGGGHQGDLLLAMRKAFKDAKAKAPSILFIDEVDSFPDRAELEDRDRDWTTGVVNALLAEVDGVQGRDGVVLIGATNDPDRVDPALRRSGRLDRHIEVGRPSQADLAAMLREHLGDDLAGEKLAGVALLATGSSGADCERYVRGARRRARVARRPMTMDDLVAELGGDATPSPTQLRRYAVHEAGHAVVATELLPGQLVSLSIRRVGFSGGRITMNVEDGYLTAVDLRSRYVMMLAGRAAELVVLGSVSTGSGGSENSDIARATHLAVMSLLSLGFGERRRLVWHGDVDGRATADRLAYDHELAREVRDLLDAAFESAVTILRHRKAALLAVADALVERTALDGDEVARIVAVHPADEATS